MGLLYVYNKYALPIYYDFWTAIRHRLDWGCENWKNPDEGIWEMRNRKEHFVYSKLMNWVALDRWIRLAEKRSFPADGENKRHNTHHNDHNPNTRGPNYQRPAIL